MYTDCSGTTWIIIHLDICLSLQYEKSQQTEAVIKYIVSLVTVCATKDLGLCMTLKTFLRPFEDLF